MGLKNTGATPCALRGYPEVRLFGAQGAELTEVRTDRTASNYFRTSGPPAEVLLAPQASAYFDLAYSAVPHEVIGETACPAAVRVQVTAPGDTASVQSDQALEPCGRRLRVSPVRAVAEPAPEVETPGAAPAPRS